MFIAIVVCDRVTKLTGRRLDFPTYNNEFMTPHLGHAARQFPDAMGFHRIGNSDAFIVGKMRQDGP